MVRTEESAPALDREAALSRVGGDVDLLREIGELFLREYPSEVADLRVAVAARDAYSIERKAHSLKGSVATFGSGPAFQAALELERQGRNHDLSDLDSNLERFETMLQRLCVELEALVSD